MPQQPKPNLRSISALPDFAFVVGQTLENTEDQHQAFSEVREKPWLLDDGLVARVIRVFETQLDDLSLFDQQFAHWQESELDSSQEQEVSRLIGQAARTRTLTESILTLAHELKENTIEQILSRDDAQLGLDMLLGKLKP